MKKGAQEKDGVQVTEEEIIQEAATDIDIIQIDNLGSYIYIKFRIYIKTYILGNYMDI